MRLGFFGGAGTVTGSRFLLETERARVLIDCGLFQGLKELRLLNWEPTAFDPRSIDAVILTHAHIDHSGYLPRLVKAGFRGPVYCTPATKDLAGILLADAAVLQEEDAEYANRRGFSKHHPALPLFDQEDAERAVGQMRQVDLDQPQELRDVAFRFHSAGHILGAAFVEVSAEERSGAATLVFSGDLGRYGAPLHNGPAPLPDCDTLVIESTYGDRVHSEEPLEEQLGEAFAETLSRGGTVLIPAFAVARAQLVTMLLRRLMERGRLPQVPIHVDSPMAIDVTEVYRRYLASEELNASWEDLFPRGVRFHRSVQQSLELNSLQGPRIIIASSGMMTGGRVLHHLRRLLPDSKNLLVLVGYQAAGTRGRKLLEGARSVRVHGRDVPVNARFIQVEGLSAHADAIDLDKWIGSAENLPRTVFLVHGEPAALAAMASRISARGPRAELPRLNDWYRRQQGGWQQG